MRFARKSNTAKGSGPKGAPKGRGETSGVHNKGEAAPGHLSRMGKAAKNEAPPQVQGKRISIMRAPPAVIRTEHWRSRALAPRRNSKLIFPSRWQRVLPLKGVFLIGCTFTYTRAVRPYRRKKSPIHIIRERPSNDTMEGNIVLPTLIILREYATSGPLRAARFKLNS